MNPSHIGTGRATKTTAKGNMFAELEDGTTAFVPARVARAISLNTDDLAYLTLIENRPSSDANATSEWFCIHAVKCDEALSSYEIDKVMSVLTQGDAWTARDISREAGTEIEATRAFLEVNFSAGNGSKFARFDKPKGSPVEVYFTLVPDQVAVAEFAD